MTNQDLETLPFVHFMMTWKKHVHNFVLAKTFNITLVC